MSWVHWTGIAITHLSAIETLFIKVHSKKKFCLLWFPESIISSGYRGAI